MTAKYVSVLLGTAGLCLATTVVLASNQASSRPQAPATRSTQGAKGGPVRMAVNTPPLPNVGFAPVRPMDVVRATYDFAANHPEVLKYVPCYCGCGSQGHKANESCFVARRDAKGNVLEWDTHGFGCTICIDVARQAMQMYSSGADVMAIRAAVEKRWGPTNADGRTPTPAPPGKK
jgi:hypothetical protein